jgi:hypothetical protein
MKSLLAKVLMFAGAAVLVVVVAKKLGGPDSMPIAIGTMIGVWAAGALNAAKARSKAPPPIKQE